jgi:hypothetical protein
VAESSDPLALALKRLERQAESHQAALDARDATIRQLRKELAAADHVRKALEHQRDIALRVSLGGPRRSIDRSHF